MKKLTILTLAAVAASAMASAAYAGGDLRMRQIGEENAAYFHQTGSGGAVVANPDYQFLSRPEQRMAARNAEYFAKIGYKGGEVKPFNPYTDVSQYPFPGSRPGEGGYVFSPAAKR